MKKIKDIRLYTDKEREMEERLLKNLADIEEVFEKEVKDIEEIN